jgi:hypothetical protein
MVHADCLIIIDDSVKVQLLTIRMAQFRRQLEYFLLPYRRRDLKISFVGNPGYPYAKLRRSFISMRIWYNSLRMPFTAAK